MTWISDYTPLFYVDVMAYPCPSPEAGLTNLHLAHGMYFAI